MQTLTVTPPPSKYTRMLSRMKNKSLSITVDPSEPEQTSLWRRKSTRDSITSTYISCANHEFNNIMELIISLFLYAKDKGYEKALSFGVNNLQGAPERSIATSDLFIQYFKDVKSIEYKKSKRSVVSANVDDLLSQVVIILSGEPMSIHELVRFEKKQNADETVNLAEGLIDALTHSDDRVQTMKNRDDGGFAFEKHATNLMIGAHLGDHNSVLRYFMDVVAPFLRDPHNRITLNQFFHQKKEIKLEKDFRLDINREIGCDPITNIIGWLTGQLIAENRIEETQNLLLETVSLLSYMSKKQWGTYALASLKRMLANNHKSVIATITDNEVMPTLIETLLNIDNTLPLTLQSKVEDTLTQMIRWRLEAIIEDAPNTTGTQLVAYYLDKIDFPDFEDERITHPAAAALTAMSGEIVDIYQGQKALRRYTAQEALYAVTSVAQLKNWVDFYQLTPSDALSMDTLSDYMKHSTLKMLISR